MKFFEKILRFFGYLSVKEIEAKISFAEYQIKTIKEENKHFRKAIEGGGVNKSIFDDLHHNSNLFCDYEKELEMWTKKLKKRKK